jgi:hypothetical protein
MLAAALAIATIWPAAASAAAPSTLTVNLARMTTPVNRGLVGFVYHPGRASLSSIAPLHPRFIRIDASLQDASPTPDTLKLDPLLRTVAAVRAIGAEPLVILSYMPAWLGQPLPGPDRTRNPPSDLGRWRALVQAVVQRLATAREPAYWFEAWNEPDLPNSWTGTPDQWSDMAAASALAIRTVANRTDLPLRFGGPASFIPDPLYETAFAERMRQDGDPVGFISWHYYANYPCVGPDGPETADVQGRLLSLLLGCRNPFGTPDWFTRGVAVVRADAKAVLHPVPPLILDEWNVSAGGLDDRMDTYVGAAFDAATLITLQRDGVDDATFYQATDTDVRPGGWGVIGPSGARKPSWWTFDLWQLMQHDGVAVDGADPSSGLYAIAARPRHRELPVTILLVNYSPASPAPRTLEIELAGRTGGASALTATIRRIDAEHSDASRSTIASLSHSHLRLSLPAQAIALVTVSARARHLSA